VRLRATEHTEDVDLRVAPGAGAQLAVRHRLKQAPRRSGRGAVDPAAVGASGTAARGRNTAGRGAIEGVALEVGSAGGLLHDGNRHRDRRRVDDRGRRPPVRGRLHPNSAHRTHSRRRRERRVRPPTFGRGPRARQCRCRGGESRLLRGQRADDLEGARGPSDQGGRRGRASRRCAPASRTRDGALARRRAQPRAQPSTRAAPAPTTSASRSWTWAVAANSRTGQAIRRRHVHGQALRSALLGRSRPCQR
jgi:hypothetical protein